jgi:Mrp family chromosome partitioning ATPase
MVNQESHQEPLAIKDKSLVGCFNNIKQVIAVMSGKGGVGKSTVSSLLAVGLRKKGFEVGLLDADITGPSVPKAFGMNTQPQGSEYGIEPPVTPGGIKLMSINFFLPHEDDPVIWRGPLLAGAVKQFWDETDWRDLDYLIVDLPPGTGDVPLTVMQSLPVAGVVIVTSPQDLVRMVVKKSVKMVHQLGIPVLGIVQNMSSAVCPHCHTQLELFGPSKITETADQLNVPALGDIPWDIRLNELMDTGNIESYDQADFEPIVVTLTQILSEGR